MASAGVYCPRVRWYTGPGRSDTAIMLPAPVTAPMIITSEDSSSAGAAQPWRIATGTAFNPLLGPPWGRPAARSRNPGTKKGRWN